ncbi:galactose mutarotase [Lonepinella koalarum]|uniref:Aldose 1-epimerase n=1 Tax=Lonepinella koalarum TaxID=53417 RepID=A0A4R1KR21_9PAST|nr:aldose epimerase family protein [Lonepinella koalarum]MDH2925752.1 galactose mutarotase [Lonepinella koalarum]TCK66579.1 aldose 1-epimerase [Lonepinella koalarum]TFJ89044.1 galactose mutarotase [Lonepinella koalarum]TYG34884.1 galactose mutarotase [Lonepinella koalarum]
MNIKIETFGQVNGERVDLIHLSNQNGMLVKITNYGCIVTSIETQDCQGHFKDIVLGFDTLNEYLQGHPFFGAVVGRYANRINHGLFKIKDQIYQLEKNELSTSQHIHGGSVGFDKYIWNYSIEKNETLIMIHFYRLSPNGESGYPGNLNITHSIGLDEQNQLHFYFTATTDQTTIINLTNHSYYNLSGHDQGYICHHYLKIFSDYYTPVAQNMIPTGEILSVKHTGLDFRKAIKIGDNMDKLKDKTLDHNFILNGEVAYDEYHKAAELYDPESGRFLTVITTQPAIQVYNAAKLSNKCWMGKNQYKYESFAAICLETQHFPDSPNHRHFPNTLLEPDQIYKQKTIYQFSVKDNQG